MPTPISGQMRASMLAVTALNDDITATQTRLNTGRKVNTALDDPATFFKAQNYQSKSSQIDDVNKNIALVMSNVKVADGAMSTMIKNMNAQISAMKDALSVPAGAVGAAAVATSRLKYTATSDSLVAVGTTATDLANAAMFQDQDKLSFTVTPLVGAAKTMNFKAVSGTLATTGDGTAAKPYEFKTILDLQGALQKAFGDSTLKLTYSSTTSQISIALQNPTDSLTIAQTSNGASAAASTAAGNAYADLAAIFGSPSSTAIQTESFVVKGVTTTVQSGFSNTYTPTAATSNKASLDTRKAVAEGYVAMINQLAALVSDAYVPGQNNLLNNLAGNTVALNGDGSTTQTLKLNQTLDPTSLKLSASDTGGTGAAGNFSQDGNLSTAISNVANALAIVQYSQKALANQSSMLNNRSDFNKTLMATMNGNSDLLLSADTTTEAANLASMQTRQAFATNNMASTKQTESGLIQLLR
ncbi:flagellin [Alsobacter sp. SYSU BS001988]